MTYVNLTPHEVTVWDYQDDGKEPVPGEGGTVAMRIAPSGTVARLTETVERLGTRPGNGYVGAWRIPDLVTLGAPVGLPEPEDGVRYVVSMPLAMGLLATGVQREDVLYPYGQVRDKAGRIVGCLGFARLVSS